VVFTETTAKLALDRATRRHFQASPQILGTFDNHDGVWRV